jgi:hypothetical protein
MIIKNPFEIIVPEHSMQQRYENMSCARSSTVLLKADRGHFVLI